MVVCPAPKSAWLGVATFFGGVQWTMKQNLSLIFINFQNTLFTTFIGNLGEC